MKTKFLIIFIAALALFGYVVFAVPLGATINQGIPDRRTTAIDSTSGVVIQAQAGNVTSLNINSIRLSSRWQGYYGNITGAITLDDVQNNTLYNWQIASPQGEVYAVNHSTTPTWANVKCFNFTDNTQNVTLTNLENSLGITDSLDSEGVNETFNLTLTKSFSAGSKTISPNDKCPVVSLYQNDVYTGVKFNETILFQNQSADMIIYTALLEQDATGFSGSTLDFEMIVGENGDLPAATNYYFYVELT